MRTRRALFALLAIGLSFTGPARAEEDPLPPFEALVAHEVSLRPELVGVHPRVFVTREGLVELRERARSTHREEWARALAELPALKGAPPPPSAAGRCPD